MDHPTGYTAPIVDWFRKYAATQVLEQDTSGGSPPVVTTYAYSGGTAWHYDDNEVVQAKYRTYGQFRGWQKVTQYVGNNTTDPRTKNVTWFYQGMSKNNSSTVVNITDSLGGVHEDRDELSGSILEHSTYYGDGGAKDSTSISSYWVSAPTASRARTGLSTLTAQFVAKSEELNRQAITRPGSSTWRKTETDWAYEDSATSPLLGLETYAYSHTVPADPDYDRCTSTTYAPANTSANIVGLVSQVETDAVACGGFHQGSPISVPATNTALTAPTSITRPDDVVSASRTYYDDPTFATTFPQPAAPTRGDVTMARSAADYTGSAFTWATTAKTAYDSHGRPVTEYDGNGNATTTSYTDNAYGLPTGSSTTNALQQTASTTLDPQRAVQLSTTDANGIVTTIHHDALGRTTEAWTQSRTTATDPNVTYAYQVRNNGTWSVTSDTLNDLGGYVRTTTIYDALLRPRQTQTPTPQGGRLLTDTFYDSRGWVSHTFTNWWDPVTTPNTTLMATGPSQTNVHDMHYLTYDGLGRVVVDDSRDGTVTQSITRTVYNGDLTTVLPPTGGIATTTSVDPLGRTDEIDQYQSQPTFTAATDPFTEPSYVTGGAPSATTYGYDSHGNQATVTADGKTWTSVFDLQGRVVSKTDPDAGASTVQYDGNGNITQTLDARGAYLSFTYDALNRKTNQYAAALAAQSPANLLGSWVYDNSDNRSGVTNPIGHLTGTTTYAGGNTYTSIEKGFTAFGSSTGTTITIPASEGALGRSYIFSHFYTPIRGLPNRDVFPAAGGLPAEQVGYVYQGALELLDGAGSNLAGYEQSMVYDEQSRPINAAFGPSTGPTALSTSYNPHTGWIDSQTTTRSVGSPATVDQQAYTRDLSGNITNQVSTRLGSSSTAETQCFDYNQLVTAHRRLDRHRRLRRRPHRRRPHPGR